MQNPSTMIRVARLLVALLGLLALTAVAGCNRAPQTVEGDVDPQYRGYGPNMANRDAAGGTDAPPPAPAPANGATGE